MKLIRWLLMTMLVLFQFGCERGKRAEAGSSAPGEVKIVERDPGVTPITADPIRLVLLPLEGNSDLDQQISKAQQKAATAPDPFVSLERLGWLFVSKARVSFDPGYYKLAEQCALSMETRRPHAPESLLLRGHVLQNLHRFKEAEPLARELTAVRGRAFDYGLLGDVLMEQGRLAEAVAAYQRMADLKPDLHAYTRAAHARWLKGDLDGAIEMMELAITAASSQDKETAAWVYSRMAMYRLQAGELEEAAKQCQAALAFQPDYPPALLARGRLLLAEGKPVEAAVCLKRAAKLNPLPEYQWVLSEALSTEPGMQDEVTLLERQIKNHGQAADPRTFALFLATRGQDSTIAVRLAQAELSTRADVFTYDALAWALAAAGRWDEAADPMRRALAEGTQDARLFLHAGVIEAKLSHFAQAEEFFRKASSVGQMLLPSEKACLRKYFAGFDRPEENKNKQNQKSRS